MPHNKNTDRVVRRILPWLLTLSISGLALYFFYPHSSEYVAPEDDVYETPYDTASEEEYPPQENVEEESKSMPSDDALDTTIDEPRDKQDTPPPESEPEKEVPGSSQPPLEIEDESEPPAEPEATPATEQTSAEADEPAASEQAEQPPEPLNGFVKHTRSFTNANNFWLAISKSDLNPTLIEQLEPLKKRLSWRSLKSVDILYSNYYSDGEFNPINSKLLMVRGNAGKNSWTFYAREKKGETYFYDSEGEAPEPSMDRAPLNYTRISSPFNPRRRHPITGRITPHEGVDLKQAYGTPVHTTGNGVVTFAGNQHGYGRIVIIHHPNGYETRYAHLSAISVKQGQHVKRGDVVGKLGNSGFSTGAHLHYEVRINGVPRDPMRVKLPSYNPIPRRDMQAWRFRTAQYREEMNDLLHKKKA
ncbi:peptidoglycan DD-metalloendopeptidase family protein [Cardiobacteriaceae bacterium TAE3-ERU3]|nr:peptidoglycan DD-metalloendopeptidase family protein [Cardiobacteriaceae bacterium TAE3-ERU3]